MINNTDGKSPSSSDAQEATPENQSTTNINEMAERSRESLLDELIAVRKADAEKRIKLKEWDERYATEQETLLVEQEKFKELADQRAQRITELQTQAEQAETYKQILDKMLEARLEVAPAHIKSLLTELPTLKALEWLEANADQLAPRQAPNLDAGKSGVQEKTLILTDEQEMFVKRMKLDREKYIANLKAEQAKRG